MACLMHDVGNPPFGHFGEYAINDWFERNLDALFERRVPPGQGDGLLQQRMLTDLKHFEGNAQAIRLVVKLLRLNSPTRRPPACSSTCVRPTSRSRTRQRRTTT